MDSETIERESLRATRFLVGQIKKGWTVEEAMVQLEGSYGHMIYTQVIYNLKRNEKSN
jgi:hypothetical protein